MIKYPTDTDTAGDYRIPYICIPTKIVEACHIIKEKISMRMKEWMVEEIKSFNREKRERMAIHHEVVSCPVSSSSEPSCLSTSLSILVPQPLPPNVRHTAPSTT